MRTTLDKLTFEVMNATADDWESLDQIMSPVKEFSGVSDRTSVANIIVQLITEGLFEEMKQQKVTAEMIVQSPMDFWFTMTKQGRSLWNSEAPKYEAAQ